MREDASARVIVNSIEFSIAIEIGKSGGIACTCTCMHVAGIYTVGLRVELLARAGPRPRECNGVVVTGRAGQHAQPRRRRC